MPDPALRRVVLGTGILLTLAGVASIVVLPVALVTKLVSGVSWCGIGIRELRLIARGYKDCERIQVDASGVAQVFDAQGRCRTATIDSGSMVLGRFAWLRLQGPKGLRHSELLGRDAARVHDWRRFQVIWRHLGAAA